MSAARSWQAPGSYALTSLYLYLYLPPHLDVFSDYAAQERQAFLSCCNAKQVWI